MKKLITILLLFITMQVFSQYPVVNITIKKPFVYINNGGVVTGGSYYQGLFFTPLKDTTFISIGYSKNNPTRVTTKLTSLTINGIVVTTPTQLFTLLKTL